MESPGARLKKIRLEKGLSLEDVHNKTKIHMNILRSIEDESLVNLNPVYLRGFLKLYCQYLGVDPHEYIVDYKEPRKEVRLSSDEAIAGDVSFMSSVSRMLKSLRPRIKIKTVLVVFAAVMIVMGISALKRFISSHPWHAAQSSRLQARAPEPAKKNSKESAAERTQQAFSSGAISLGILPKDRCYLYLKVDGKTLFKEFLKKGRYESWQAKDKIEIVSLGNAGAVDLEINGKPIAKLGKKGQSLKNIVITREGLSVGR